MAVVKTLDVTLKAHTLGFEQGLKHARASMTGFAADVRSSIASLIGVSAGLGTIGLAMRSMVQRSREFTQSMASSTAIMGSLSEETRRQMELTAKQVAYNTRYSAKEVADAYYFLASAGLDAAQSIKAMPVVAKFAQAGMFDLSLATDLLTDAQMALGQSSKEPVENMRQMQRVADVLVRANTLANASVQQFSESLTTKSGAALKVLGKSIEEGVAVLAAFANQGVKGEEAGTQFTIVLRDLQTQAIQNAAAWEYYNVKVFDSVGEMRNMADIIGDLEARLGGLSDQAKKTAMLELGFSDKSVAATMMLLGQSGSIRQMEESLRNASGYVEEVASKQMPDLEEKIKNISDVWDIFSTQVGGEFLQAITGAANGAEGFAEILATIADIVHTIYLGWVHMKPVITAVIQPVHTLMGALSLLGMQMLNTIQMGVDFARTIPGGALATDVSGVQAAINATRQQFNAALAASNIGRITGEVAAGKDALMADTPGQRFLASLRQIQNPLGVVEGATNNIAASMGNAADQLNALTGNYASQTAMLAEQEKRVREQARYWEEITTNAEHIRKQYRTPDEIFAERVMELNQLRSLGAISDVVFNRAFAGASKEFDDSIKTTAQEIHETISPPGALERGTSQAFSQFQANKRAAESADKSLDVQKKMEQHLADIRRNGILMGVANI